VRLRRWDFQFGDFGVYPGLGNDRLPRWFLCMTVGEKRTNAAACNEQQQEAAHLIYSHRESFLFANGTKA
jgi:hypothetical protein